MHIVAKQNKLSYKVIKPKSNGKKISNTFVPFLKLGFVKKQSFKKVAKT